MDDDIMYCEELECATLSYGCHYCEKHVKLLSLSLIFLKKNLHILE